MMLRAICFAAFIAFGLASSSSLASASCPLGDAPAAVGELDITRVDAAVGVDRGVARAVWKVVLENRGHGPGKVRLNVTVATGQGRSRPIVVDRIQLEGHGRTKIAAATDAREQYDTFTEALERGVAADAAVATGERAAVLAELDQDGDVVVEVAATCSRRRLVLVIEASTTSIAQAGGERYLLPRFSKSDRIVVENTSDDEAVDIWSDGTTLPASGRVPALDLDRLAALDEVPPVLVLDVRRHEQRLRATGLLQRAGVDDTLFQASLELPTTLTTTPAALRFVFVVDTSVSAGEAGVALALRQLMNVLDAAPADARWALITAGRTPRLVVAPWRGRDERFIPPPTLENGSNIPAAIARALQIAEDVDDGAGRVIVLSDLQLSSADEGPLLSALTRKTSQTASPIVHLVELPTNADETVLGFSRVEGGSIADATTTRGGVHLVARQHEDGDEVELARHLIAPRRLDSPRLFVDGVELDRDDTADERARSVSYAHANTDDVSVGDRLPPVLHAGSSLQIARLLRAGARHVELRALAWATPVTFTFETVDAAAAVGSVVNGVLREELTTEMTMALAMPLHFVSSATSLVRVPRFRPGEDDFAGGFGMSCGCGCRGAIGSGRSGHTTCAAGTAIVLQAQRLLDARAAEIAERCKIDVHVSLEVGDLEILAVEVDHKASQKVRRCVTEQWWQTRLDTLTPGDGSFEVHRTFRVSAVLPSAEVNDADQESDVGDT